MLRALRSLYRLFQMARSAARHGALAPFEEALAGAGLTPVVLFFIRVIFGRPVGDLRPGERLANALSELGPAFIKFGQVLSTRSDLLARSEQLQPLLARHGLSLDLEHLQQARSLRQGLAPAPARTSAATARLRRAVAELEDLVAEHAR